MATERPLGLIIRDVLEASGMKMGVFAERIGTTRQNVYKIFAKSSIPTGRLLKISEVLNYDFSQHLHLELPGRPSRFSPLEAQPNVRYADLAKELEAAHERIRTLEQRLKDKEEIIELLRARLG